MQNRKRTQNEGQDLFDLFDLFITEEDPEVKIISIQTKAELEIQSGWILIEIENKPAPRPRARIMNVPGKKPAPQIYNPPEYTQWKKKLSNCIASTGIEKAKYNSIDLIIGIPLRKSYKKREKESKLDTLNDIKPDFDNFTKGVLDAISDSGVLQDDNVLGSGLIEKIWISEKEKPFILFNLKMIMQPRLNHRKLMVAAKKYIS